MSHSEPSTTPGAIETLGFDPWAAPDTRYTTVDARAAVDDACRRVDRARASHGTGSPVYRAALAHHADMQGIATAVTARDARARLRG